MNTGIAPNIEKYASELIEVAHYYDIRQLTEECGSCIFKNIDEDNYIDALSLAETSVNRNKS